MKEESDEILSTDRDLKSLDITSIQKRYCFHLGRFLPAFLISNFSHVNICSVLQNSTRTSSLEVFENRRSSWVLSTYFCALLYCFWLNMFSDNSLVKHPFRSARRVTFFQTASNSHLRLFLSTVSYKRYVAYYWNRIRAIKILTSGPSSVNPTTAP